MTNPEVEFEREDEFIIDLGEGSDIATTDHSKLNNLDYENSGHTGFTRKVRIEFNSSTYKLKVKILDESDNVIDTSNEIDLPIEELITNIEYHETYEHEGITYHKVLVFTLKSGAITIVPVSDIVSGLASVNYVDAQIQLVNSDIEIIENRVETLENKPYISLERLTSYLYKITFDDIPEYEDLSNPVISGCSSFVREGKLYRNLDWNYDNTASFKVITKDFIGMSFINGLNDGELEDKKLGQLPYHVVDGINNSGLMVSTHVLFNDWNYTGSGSKSQLLTQIPYYILSNLHDINNLSSLLNSYLANIKVPQALIDMGYLVQYLITDGTTTYAILPPTTESGTYEIVDITSNPKLTNFRWVDRSQVIRTESDIQNRPTGIERWNLINQDTKLEDLKFTECYTNPDRLSEFIGIDGTTKNSTDTELQDIYNRASQEYQVRTRNGLTWQSVHSVVYSQNGMESLFVQENYTHDFASESDELKSLIEAEKQAREQADTGLSNRIGTIESDYLKNADKTELEGLIGAEAQERIDDVSSLDTRLSAIENDYLKEADKTELEGDINSVSSDLATEIINRTNAETDINNALNSLTGDVNTIKGKIPNQASASNQLADKDFVNSSINSVSAFYITKNASGDPFSTKAELTSATQFYSGGELRTPTRNDYCFILADESKQDPTTHENPSTRYIYNNGWEFQFIVNKTSLTSAQLSAINSGITSSLVSKLNSLENYDDTEVKADITALENGKVDKVSGKGLSTNDYDNTEKSNVASNTSARHTHSNKSVLDTLLDNQSALDSKFSAKANDSAVVHNTGNENIDGIKTFNDGIDTIEINNSTGNLTIKSNDSTRFIVKSSTLQPSGTKDLGTNSALFRDLYLSGNLTDGTNAVSISDIATIQTNISNLDTNKADKSTTYTKTQVDTALSGKANTSDLSAVATSGSYNDLSNKPTIPTITDTYDSTSSNGMSGKAVASAISSAITTALNGSY